MIHFDTDCALRLSCPAWVNWNGWGFAEQNDSRRVNFIYITVYFLSFYASLPVSFHRPAWEPDISCSIKLSHPSAPPHPFFHPRPHHAQPSHPAPRPVDSPVPKIDFDVGRYSIKRSVGWTLLMAFFLILGLEIFAKTTNYKDFFFTWLPEFDSFFHLITCFSLRYFSPILAGRK